MRVVRNLDRLGESLERAVVTLGNFDGVHVGHRRIVESVVQEATRRGSTAVALTFFPHPTRVLVPDKAPLPISSLASRLASLRELGIDLTVVQRFTLEFSKVEADEFVERLLVGSLRAEKIVIGHSVSFGRNRRGNDASLRAAGKRLGFEVEVVGPVEVEGIEVSSSRIRRALTEGEVALASRLLGRPYVLEGRVVVGKRRGAGLGFPTANLRASVPPLVPDGVYAIRADGFGESRNGVANIGTNPTFGEGADRTVEAHLFDVAEDLYGRRMRIHLVERLRGEVRFPGPEALVEQIRRDVARAREVLSEP